MNRSNYLVKPFYTHLLARDPTFDLTTMSRTDFDQLSQLGLKEYSSMLRTADPDLRSFEKAGGKMVTWHGLVIKFNISSPCQSFTATRSSLTLKQANHISPQQATESYYMSVSKISPNVHDFYRYFVAPGVGHCMGGAGGAPTGLFDQLRAWVENGTAPDSSPVSFTDSKGQTHNRIVCPFPETAKYINSCGNATAEKCWRCSH